MRLLLLVLATLTASCAAPITPTEQPKGASAVPMRLSSSAFADGAPIPREYTCDAANQQLPMEWSGAPDGTAEFALTMDDPDAGGFVHWVVTGIPPSVTSIEGGLPPGATSGRPYRGPCPPSGTHHYVLTLYALSAPLSGAPLTTVADVQAAAADKTLATATLTGTYIQPSSRATADSTLTTLPFCR